MNCFGDCFVVLPSEDTSPLFVGRNTLGEEELGVAQEVCFYKASDACSGKTDGGIDATSSKNTVDFILQKPRPGVWGGDFGANEQNLTIAITWALPIDSDSHLAPTDIIRIVVASSTTVAAAKERIDELLKEHAGNSFKANFLIVDVKGAWLMSCAGKVWAAQKLRKGFHRIPSNGFPIETNIHECSNNLNDLVISNNLWDGKGVLNFAACFHKTATVVESDTPKSFGHDHFDLVDMFGVLRYAANPKSARASCVSVLNIGSVCSYWFTATPNAAESVFKPFVFSPHPKISTLTMVLGDMPTTVLHELHRQRKPSALEDLKALEASCISEVNSYIHAHSTADDELDELMKDCVEAEVKFYR